MQTNLDPHYVHNLQMVFLGDHHNPHTILGLHDFFDGKKVIRLWRPGAQTAYLEVFGQVTQAQRLDEIGLFECVVPGHTTFRDYRIWHSNGLLGYDPYAFWPTIGELDQYL